ncbi:MAG: SRPBCC domain-containing protein [Pseudomonadota bacterium]
MTDAIEKTVTVPLDASAAFSLFTTGIDRWWPKDRHSIAARDGDGDKARVRIEERKGGRVIETLPDGSERPWATVTDWAPGAHFSLDWYVGGAPEGATRLHVTFTQTEAGTRVDLTHDRWSVHGDKAAEVSAQYRSGWDHVLCACFRKACQTLEPTA